MVRKGKRGLHFIHLFSILATKLIVEMMLAGRKGCELSLKTVENGLRGSPGKYLRHGMLATGSKG